MQPLQSPFSGKSSRFGGALWQGRQQETRFWIVLGRNFPVTCTWPCINSEETCLVRRLAFNAGNEKKICTGFVCLSSNGVINAKHLLLRPWAYKRVCLSLIGFTNCNVSCDWLVSASSGRWHCEVYWKEKRSFSIGRFCLLWPIEN